MPRTSNTLLADCLFLIKTSIPKPELTSKPPHKAPMERFPPTNNSVNKSDDAQLGIKPGLNLLVGADKIDYAKKVYERFGRILSPDQIILVPQRFSNTPTPKQLASVASGKPFQSPSCLLKCKRPSDFCSVSWDKKVSSCSFSPSKVPLETLDYKGLVKALGLVRWRSCQ